MDIQYLLLLQNLRESIGDTLNGFMEFVTKLGDPKLIPLLLGLVYWCLDKHEGVYLALTFYANRLVNGFLKITACIYRPWIRDARVTPVPSAMVDATGYSFPSGHAANSTSFYGGLAMKKTRRKALRALFIVMILVIAFSRNYLGVHTPQDVGVSIICGTAMLFAARWLLKVVDEKPGTDKYILLAGVVIGALLVLYAQFKSYPVDYDANGAVIVDPAKMAIDSYKNAGMGMGFFLGWFLERRYIRFSTDGAWWVKAIRFVVLAVSYVYLKKLLALVVGLFLTGGLASAVEAFGYTLYLMAGAPLLIRLCARWNGKK